MSLVFSLFLSWMYLCELVHSRTLSSYNYGDSIDRNTITKRQQPSSPFVVTGVQTSRGPTPLRLEVRQLEQDPTLWTLYILGLDMLQYTNQTEMLSWYQITGLPITAF
jgi:tyrosinase